MELTASDLTGPSGRRIAASNLALFLERYIDVTVSSRDYSGRGNRPLGPGRYPDGLVPFRTASGERSREVPFDLSAGENQPVWVDLFVPRGSPPGVYTGAITVRADQGKVSVPVALTVWNFELPLKPSLRSSFSIQRESSQSDRAYLELLLEHKITPQVVRASAAPDLMVRAGLGLAGLPFWSDQRGCTMKAPPSVPRLLQAVDAYPPDLDLFLYVADEIEDSSCLFPIVRQWARNLHQTRVKSLVTVYPMDALLDDGTGRSAVDIWAMLPKHFNPADDAFRRARRLGNELWSYTAIVQDDYSPKWLIDYAPINFRIMPGFLNASLGLTGILYWAVDSWTRDPWNDPDYVGSDGHHYQGEGKLIYPGPAVGDPGPVPSMRLKWIREGVEDYEYVRLLESIGRTDFALRVVRHVATDWHQWTKDPAVLEQARLELGTELDRLGGKPAPSADVPARPAKR